KEDRSMLLSVKICQGLRPEIEKGTPKCFTNLMKLCWGEDPTKRPTAKELYKKLYIWLNEPTDDVKQQFEAAEEYRQKTAKYLIETGKTNPGTIYHSKLFSIEQSSI